MARLAPPQRIPLSAWIESSLRLPEGQTDTPGRVRLWPFQPAIADAMSDPEIERITLVKPTRVGFTTLITGLVGSHIANDPAAIGFYLPTEDDCRQFMVTQMEPVFEATPSLAKVLIKGEDDRGRNTILQRLFAGGAITMLAAKSPRNFRAHNFRIVIFDEADAMEATKEGNPIDLGSKRSDGFRNRKIVVGSTPIYARTSNVLRSYALSDRRVFEVPCPACGALFQILWPHIVWDEGRPETARCRCPHCKEDIPERYKAAMVGAGSWRAQNPERTGHAGFRLNALVSLLPTRSWAALAEEWLAKHKDPDTRQVFVNTVLAEGWEEDGEEIQPGSLERMFEDWTLAALPPEVLLLTAGVDVQHDRVEVTILGWGRPIQVPAPRGGEYTLEAMFVAGHFVLWGKPETDAVWEELDGLLGQTWPHPLGGKIKIATTVVDSGNWTDEVYDYCFDRGHKKIFAGKGASGWKRPSVHASESKVKSQSGRSGRLYIIGVDPLKRRIFTRLQLAGGVRAARDVPERSPEYIEQLTSERRVLRYVSGQPKEVFERKRGARAEALDCMVYGWAAREMLTPSWDALEAGLKVRTAKRESRLGKLSAVMHGKGG